MTPESEKNSVALWMREKVGNKWSLVFLWKCGPGDSNPRLRVTISNENQWPRIFYYFSSIALPSSFLIPMYSVVESSCWSASWSFLIIWVREYETYIIESKLWKKIKGYDLHYGIKIIRKDQKVGFKDTQPWNHKDLDYAMDEKKCLERSGN